MPFLQAHLGITLGGGGAVPECPQLLGIDGRERQVVLSEGGSCDLRVQPGRGELQPPLCKPVLLWGCPGLCLYPGQAGRHSLVYVKPSLHCPIPSPCTLEPGKE